MSAVEFEVSLDALTEAMNCSWPKSAGELIGTDGHAADGEETGHDAGMIKGADRTGRRLAPKDQLPWSFDFVRGLPVTDETGSSGVGGGNSHDSTTTMAVADGEQWCPDWAKLPLPKASGGPPPPLVTAQPQPALDWGAWPTAAADGDDLFAPPKAAAEGEAEVASFPAHRPARRASPSGARRSSSSRGARRRSSSRPTRRTGRTASCSARSTSSRRSSTARR